MLTARMMIALFRSEDTDLSYLQQALATVYARKGEQADAYLEEVLGKVPKRRADIVLTLAAQVRAERSNSGRGLTGPESQQLGPAAPILITGWRGSVPFSHGAGQ